MQDFPSSYENLRNIITSEIKRKNDRIAEYDKLIKTELSAYKNEFENEFASKNVSIRFEPVLHKNSPSIKIQISNPQNAFVIHILLDSYSAPFIVGHRSSNLSGTQEGGEIARNCDEIKALIRKRINANTSGW